MEEVDQASDREKTSAFFCAIITNGGIRVTSDKDI